MKSFIYKFLKKKTKEVNSIADIDFNKIEGEDIQWLLNTLHNMTNDHGNDSDLGEAIRSFFLRIDDQHKEQLEKEDE